MTRGLPPGWEWVRLGDLGVEVRGQVKPEPGVTYDLYSVPAFPSRRPERVDGASIKSGKRSVLEGDVLLCKINPRINRVWVVARADGCSQIASTEYLVLRLHDPRMAPVIQWYLSSPRFRDWIKLSVEGATGSHTRAKSGPILDQEIPLPPTDEQKRIVVAIEEHFARLDAAVRSLHAAEGKLRAFPSILANVATRGWACEQLGRVAEVFVGSTPSRSRSELWKGPVPWVSSGEVQFRRIRETRESISIGAVKPDRIHPPGTVLLGMIGEGRTRGQAAILDIAAAHNQNSAAIRVDRSKLIPEWLFHVFRAQYEANRGVGSGNNQPALNKSRVRELVIPLPPVTEQARLIRTLSEAMDAMDHAGAEVQRAQQQCSALYKSVLADAFAGRLVPQEPNDEPASALLERITASRQAT